MGRWDRNRTCTLRLWSTRRAVQSRPGLSKLPSNSYFLATHRPAASKYVQPLCSQFCSQGDLHLRKEMVILSMRIFFYRLETIGGASHHLIDAPHGQARVVWYGRPSLLSSNASACPV
jgi:hypothetical protein